MPASVNDFFVIRFAVCAEKATADDIGEAVRGGSSTADVAWTVITEVAAEVLKRQDEEREAEEKEDVVRTMEKKHQESLQYQSL